MATESLSTTRSTSSTVAEHLADHNKVHALVNRARLCIGYDTATGQWEAAPAHKAGLLEAYSTAPGDAVAPPPHTQSQTNFVPGDVWEWNPAGGPG